MLVYFSDANNRKLKLIDKVVNNQMHTLLGDVALRLFSFSKQDAAIFIIQLHSLAHIRVEKGLLVKEAVRKAPTAS